jgi:hypothetical protein
MRSAKAQAAAKAFKKQRRTWRSVKGLAPLRDPAYLAWIRTLPCVVCLAGEISQHSPTEAAHVGERGLRQKCSDRHTVPLCGEHHREGPYAQHRIGARFWMFWGLDRDAIIADLQRRYPA